MYSICTCTVYVHVHVQIAITSNMYMLLKGLETPIVIFHSCIISDLLMYMYMYNVAHSNYQSPHFYSKYANR